MTRTRQRRRGFAMVIAIVMVGLIAMSLATLGITFALQASRTQSQAEEAQLRQLLLAGAQAACAQATANSGPHPAIWSLSLPNVLCRQGATVTLETFFDSSGRLLIHIEAALPHRRLAQDVRFKQEGGAWHLVLAELGR